MLGFNSKHPSGLLQVSVSGCSIINDNLTDAPQLKMETQRVNKQLKLHQFGVVIKEINFSGKILYFKVVMVNLPKACHVVFCHLMCFY